MTYIHPEKLVSVGRIMARKKARSKPIPMRPVASINTPKRKTRKYSSGNSENLVHNLAQHMYAVNQARGR